MSANPAAKIYAGALHAIANDKKSTDTVRGEFESFLILCKGQPALVTALSSHGISSTAKMTLATELAQKLGLSTEFSRLLILLVQKNRISLLEQIYLAYQALVDEETGTIRGEVTSVEPVSDAQREDLAHTFGKKFKKKVLLDQKIDKAILGGLIVKVGGLTFDGSLKNTMDSLKANLERQSL